VRRERDPGPDRATAGCGETPPLGAVLEFMRLIWGISHGLQATSKQMETRLGITGPQRLVVRIVGRCPGASAGQLAEILQLHPSTLTGVLRRLEERDVVERSPGEHDRRQAHFRLTATGQTIDRRHAGTVEDAVRRVLSDLEPAKIVATAEVLRALEAELKAAPARRRRPPVRVRRSRRLVKPGHAGR
jgi:MarR family transcriptional regulator, organic hydroperoxide resistance regulator